MRKSPRTLLAAGLVAGALSICAWSSPLRAQEASAEELFRRGNLSYDLGRYDEAIDFFQLGGPGVRSRGDHDDPRRGAVRRCWLTRLPGLPRRRGVMSGN